MPTSGSDVATTSDAGPKRLTGAAAIRLHLTLAAGLAVCVAAFAIEVVRATSGNTLSWAYVFEWPAFAGYSLYMWWSLLNGRDRRERRAVKRGEVHVQVIGGGRDEKLEAWHRYLAELEAADAEWSETR